MAKRWALISSGVARGDIKIEGNNIYVKKLKHGHATESGFEATGNSSVSALVSTSAEPSSPNVLATSASRQVPVLPHETISSQECSFEYPGFHATPSPSTHDTAYASSPVHTNCVGEPAQQNTPTLTASSIASPCSNST